MYVSAISQQRHCMCCRALIALLGCAYLAYLVGALYYAHQESAAAQFAAALARRMARAAVRRAANDALDSLDDDD